MTTGNPGSKPKEVLSWLDPSAALTVVGVDMGLLEAEGLTGPPLYDLSLGGRFTRLLTSRYRLPLSSSCRNV